MSSPFDLRALRSEFPILSRSVYMISNSLGAMPRGAAEGLAEYAETWATRGVRAWAERWWGMGVEIGNRVARLIGAAPGSVSMHENVTTAHAVVLSTLALPGRGRAAGRLAGQGLAARGLAAGRAARGLSPIPTSSGGLSPRGHSHRQPPRSQSLHLPSPRGQSPHGARRRIVCTEGDFPSTIYLCRAQEALGFELVLVPAEPDSSVDVQRVVDAIDERTALVAVSHVLFRSAFILDPAPIVERAHAVGARVVLDTYQSAGIVPLDVAALGVDFATGGCLKWLCGGPGNAFLYTRPDLLPTLAPRLTGWFSHPEPFAFRPDDFEALPDARRMMNGTPSIPAWHAAIAGLDILAGSASTRCARGRRR